MFMISCSIISYFFVYDIRNDFIQYIIYDIIIKVLYHRFFDIILLIYESLPNFHNVTRRCMKSYTTSDMIS